MIFDQIRGAMSIDEEIATFEKRLGSLATSIQEQQEKRQAFLLTIISVISAIDAVEGILAGMKQMQVKLGWSSWTFFSTLIIILLTTTYFLIGYLFPLHAQKIKRAVRKVTAKRRKNE
jgi:Mg2+ and Co2+ transporter CorA